MRSAKGKRIRQVIGMTGLSIKDFSAKNDMNYNTFNLWINGNNENLTVTAAQKISDAALNCGVFVSTLWLMLGLGEPPKLKSKPVHESAPDSNAQLIEMAYQNVENADREIAEFAKNTYGSVTLHILDHSMEPSYRNGDYVGGTLIKKDFLEKAVDKNCIVKLVGFQMMCRKLVQGAYQYFLLANTINNDTQNGIIYNLNIEFIAPVTRVWHV